MVLPECLQKEAETARKIINNFTCASSDKGTDKMIPSDIIEKAKGIAVLSVLKGGFLVTARGGSGIVIARLKDGNWSAPSALGIAGLGGGFQIGLEKTDFLFILNSDRAVKAFCKGGNVTLGGNLSVAAGPLGRNGEVDVTMRGVASIYTYSKTKGLFAGISIEGSGLIERKDANRRFYGREITSSEILTGIVDPPIELAPLYNALDAEQGTRRHYSSGGIECSNTKSTDQKSLRQKTNNSTGINVAHATIAAKRGAKFASTPLCTESNQNQTNEFQYQEYPKSMLALWDFGGELPCDLRFKAGDIITVVTPMDSLDEWWEGRTNGRTGLFPPNYCESSSS